MYFYYYYLFFYLENTVLGNLSKLIRNVISMKAKYYFNSLKKPHRRMGPTKYL